MLIDACRGTRHDMSGQCNISLVQYMSSIVNYFGKRCFIIISKLCPKLQPFGLNQLYIPYMTQMHVLYSRRLTPGSKLTLYWTKFLDDASWEFRVPKHTVCRLWDIPRSFCRYLGGSVYCSLKHTYTG